MDRTAKMLWMHRIIDVGNTMTAWVTQVHKGQDEPCWLLESYGCVKERLRFLMDTEHEALIPDRMLQQLRQHRIFRKLQHNGVVAHGADYRSLLKKQRFCKVKKLATCGLKSCQICLLATVMKNMGCDVGHNVPYLCTECYSCESLVKYGLKEVLYLYDLDDIDFDMMRQCNDVCFISIYLVVLKLNIRDFIY